MQIIDTKLLIMTFLQICNTIETMTFLQSCNIKYLAC